MKFLASFRCFGTRSRSTGRHHGASDDAGEFKKEWLPVIKKEAKKRKARMKKLKEQDQLQAQFEARIQARIARPASSNEKKKQEQERKYQDVSEDSIYIYIRNATGTTFTVKTIQPGHHIYIIT